MKPHPAIFLIRGLRAILFSCLLMGLGVCSLVADEPESLFDGKSLDGWKGLPQFWSVADGVIVGETTAENPTKGNTFFVWQGGELADFDITCLVRFRGNNSGLQYRSSIVDADNFVLAGYQADLHPKPEYFGMLYGEKLGKRGIIAQRGQRVEVGKDGATKVVGEVGDGATLTDWEWNTLRVIVVGNRLIHQVNGVTTVDITDHHPEALAKGVIGLQLHAGPAMRVEFKDIQLRRLSGDAAKAALEKAIASGAATKQAAKAAPAESAKDSYGWVSSEPLPQWIWRTEKNDNEPIYLRKTFEAPSKLASARLYATCDNYAEIWINGKRVGEAPDWGDPIMRDDVASLLKPGKNVIAVRAQNKGGVAAFVLKLSMEGVTPEASHVLSDLSWKLSFSNPDGWEQPDFDDSGWKEKLMTRGNFGVQPWGIAGIQGPGGGGAPQKKSPLTPEDITAVEGFKVELLYTVPREEQGSWVALTKMPGGKLIASDQGKAGFFEIEISEGATPQVKVEKVPAEVSGAMGMTWAFDSLYAHISGKTLVRVHDSNGDGRLDAVEDLPGANGGGEHGNHAVIPTEDGKHLYVIAGNHTNLMEIAGSRVPTWDEDLLLPRQWDARGHARGRLAPGGWVATFDPKSKTYEVLATGFRNEYDIALNKHGDLFTYDADMEWDMGMPWYRPTRICHVVSGADFGWRSGTGKWPTYYEDSLPPLVEIGPGSPTGVVSGIGTAFPTKYQDAIYALDWTFGTIYAIHTEEDGAGYKGTSEPFVYGAPLPVTDAIVGDDGALYFTIGGRNTQSALYRVTYDGPTPSETPAAENTEAKVARATRATRAQLEVFHGKAVDGAVEQAWPHLSSSDRFLRHAARVALESQPVDQWADRVIVEATPQARITGAVALARMGDPAKHREPLLASLQELDPASLNDSQLLGLLRAYALNFIRLGRPTIAERDAVIAELDPLLPHANADVNTELVRVLVYLESPTVIGKAMELIVNRGAPEVPNWTELASRNAGYGGKILEMLAQHPPSREINYAFMLRNLKDGWTLKQRRQYFEFLSEAAKFTGGASFTGFLTNLRDEALGNCTNAERTALADLTGESFNPVPDFEIKPPKGPGQNWSLEAASKSASGGAFKKASFENGRSLFHAIGCAACHRFNGLGGDIGPDITSIRNKFDANYVLESIIDPSKVISDQYGSFAVTLKNGDLHTGLVVEKGETVDIYPPVNGADAITVKTTDVAKIEQSPVSQMPPGLINGLNADEVRDLLAYLMSGGDAKDKVYGN